jgi:hypothetical protein
MRIPESHTEYWELSREERKRLFEEYGISHRMMPTEKERIKGITYKHKRHLVRYSPFVEQYLKQIKGECGE